MFNLCKNTCTCFVDSWFGTDISICCLKHDIKYETQYKSKERADEDLYNCIKARTNRVLASAMWLGVRAGGYITSWNKIKDSK
jgi:hypothetical protein